MVGTSNQSIPEMAIDWWLVPGLYSQIIRGYTTGWWFGIMEFLMTFHSVGNVIIPTDIQTHIFQGLYIADASLLSMVPAAARSMSLPWWRLLASWCFIRHNLRHVAAASNLPTWAESDFLLASRVDAMVALTRKFLARDPLDMFAEEFATLWPLSQWPYGLILLVFDNGMSSIILYLWFRFLHPSNLGSWNGHWYFWSVSRNWAVFKTLVGWWL